MSDSAVSAVGTETCSLVYIYNKTKEKIEIVKVEHQKLLNNPFSETKMVELVHSKKHIANEVNKQQSPEIEHARVRGSL